MKLRVMGWFHTGTVFGQFDEHTAFVSVNTIRQLYFMAPGTADYIYIKLKNPFAAAAIKKQLHCPPATA